MTKRRAGRASGASSWACSSALGLWLAVGGCASLRADVGVTLRISSSPPGSLVLLSRSGSFDEKTAIELGRTPLMRWLPMPGSGEWRIELSQRGCREWQGALSAASPTVHAELQCREQLGDPVGMGLSRLRVRLVLADVLEMDSGQPIDVTREQSFRDALAMHLEAELLERHGGRVAFEPGWSDETREDWRIVERRFEHLRAAKLAYYPSPHRAKPGIPLLDAALADGEGLLLVAVVGRVSSATQRLGMVLDSLDAAMASAAMGGLLVPSRVAARPDHVSARLIGIRAADRELLSIDQLALRGIPTEPNTIAALARQIALAIPPGWFEAR